jgi:hypothetical protein
MILRQTVCTTKLSTAIWTAERQQSFLHAYLTFHLIKRLSH